MGLELGKTYGDYEIIDIVSSSRAGVAYRVRNHRLERTELMRVLSATVEEDPEQEERFLRESNLRSRLQHPNIVEFYAAMLLEGHYVLLTELVEGTTLEGRIELGPLEVEEAVSYAVQALEALGHAHEAGVVHRDVRPANLIVTPEGKVKLTGFQLAKGAVDATLTQMGTSLGQVQYTSPEQVRGVEAPDARSDLYSLAVVLYEALTGRRPFESKSQFDIMMAHVNTPPAPPRSHRPEIPEAVEAAVLRALEKNPADRFENAAAFVEALRPGCAREEVSAPVVVPEVLPAAVLEAAAAPAAEECVEPEEVVVIMSPAPEPLEVPTAEPRRPTLPGVRIAASEENKDVLPPDLAGLGFGVREMLLLSLGIFVVVASVFLVQS